MKTTKILHPRALEEMKKEYESSLERAEGKVKQQQMIALDKLEEMYSYTIEKLIEIEEKAKSELGEEANRFLLRLIQHY